MNDQTRSLIQAACIALIFAVICSASIYLAYNVGLATGYGRGYEAGYNNGITDLSHDLYQQLHDNRIAEFPVCVRPGCNDFFIIQYRGYDPEEDREVILALHDGRTKPTRYYKNIIPTIEMVEERLDHYHETIQSMNS